MKLTNFKTIALMLSASALLALNGCGSTGDSSDSGFGDTTPPTPVLPIEPPVDTNDTNDTEPEPGPGELGYQVINADGSITYVTYTGGTKTAPPSAADAEYHTDVGYGNTLFDSADKKCMNCHNELYDTWKSSMHGKSWTDPIFQSKFQDFLRTHINKIDENKTNVGNEPLNGKVYTEAMIPKVAQTCIKCHAPGAYYAGDFSAVLEPIGAVGAADTAAYNDAKSNVEDNIVRPPSTEYPEGTGYDATQPATVVAVSHTNKTLYKLTYQIGHEANIEGINCAFCHSIETPRLMKANGLDNGTYTLAKDMRVGPHGPIKAPKDTNLTYNDLATDADMNKFFRLWGPEKYHDNTSDKAHTPKGVNSEHVAGEFDIGKLADGRYTMASKDINGTDGKTHFTGGPFYGPYGVTGTTNENGTDDDTNRTAHINPHYDVDGNNHFGESGKGLCLSCHQRSAGAWSSDAGAFMELCSTQMAVTTGGDIPSSDTSTSPKCQKCHMERIEGTVLHQWARPDKLFTLADNPALTGHFDPEDPDGYGDDNPVAAGWLNSHAFLGASKTGQKASVTAKIQSGFDSTLTTEVATNTLTVKTTLKNLTAHMFPGAHPMRRVLTRVIVSSDQGDLNVTSPEAKSVFATIQNNVQPLAGKTLHSSAEVPVEVVENDSRLMTFPGKVLDFAEAGEPTSSQKFDGASLIIKAADYTAFNQYITSSGNTEGNVTNAAIVTSSDNSNFTRIYGHETGKVYNIDGTDTFVVRPGFDSNHVETDNRLSPNEEETYTLTYDITDKDNVTVTYKVYYMQKGANGKFPLGSDGFLKPSTEMSLKEKKLLITEVATHTEVL